MPRTHRKTEAGRQALSTRQPPLPRAVRNLLVMIDGKRSDAELLAMLGASEVDEAGFAQLRELGLIEAAEVSEAAAPAEDFAAPPSASSASSASSAPSAAPPAPAARRPAAATPSDTVATTAFSSAFPPESGPQAPGEPAAAPAPEPAPQGARGGSMFARLGQGVRRALQQAQEESPREISAGLAEIVKCAALADADLFVWLETQIEALRAREPAAMSLVLQRVPELRAQIDAQDRMQRRSVPLLSFGTRLGGVIESLAGYGEYLHGEALSLGLCLACALGEDAGVQTRSSAVRLRDLLERAGLPTRLPRASQAMWLQWLPVDRPGPQGMLELILLEDIARPQLRRIAPSAVLDALERAGALSS
ncbi:MAG: hypothetical protein KGJ64_05145 [Betaproteobacteria bacterium]|nr:hypothetical protein [Betaproteobacteria bacterium]